MDPNTPTPSSSSAPSSSAPNSEDEGLRSKAKQFLALPRERGKLALIEPLDFVGCFEGGLKCLAELKPETDLWKKVNEKAVELLDDWTNSREERATKEFTNGYAVIGRSDGAKKWAADDIFSQLFALPSGKDRNLDSHFTSLVHALIVILSLTLDAGVNYGDQGTTSSLDLLPLYGDQEGHRTKNGGEIEEDMVASESMLLTSSARAILKLFNRNHNWIAQRLAANPAMGKNDENIFKAARIINCVQFKNMVMQELVKALAQLPPVGPNVAFDLDVPKDTLGLGNRLVRWAESRLLYQCFHLEPEENPPGDLAAEILKAIQTPAGAYRPQNTKVTRKEEIIKAIERSRGEGVCTLNQFRNHLGLKAYLTFEDWNPAIAARARQLYHHDINQLDLFVGLHCERPSENKDGLGFGLTLRYGMLVDLITIVRGDGTFRNKNIILESLTEWGVEECKIITDNGAHGSVLAKLLLRHFPDKFPFNNTYALFPFVCPEYLKRSFKARLGVGYDFKEPNVLQPVEVTTLPDIEDVMEHSEKFGAPYLNGLEALTGGYGHMLGRDDRKLHDLDLMMVLYALMPDVRSFKDYSEYFAELIYCLLQRKSKDGRIDVAKDVIIPACIFWVRDRIFGEIQGKDPRKKFEEIDAILPELQEDFNDFELLFSHLFRRDTAESHWRNRGEASRISAKLRERIDKRWRESTADKGEHGWLNWFKVLALEYVTGMEVQPPTALSFLERLTKAGKSTVGRFQYVVASDEMQPLLKTLSGKGPVEARKRLEGLRISANALGLAIVASVNFAQVCVEVIDFYLADERKGERQELINLCKEITREETMNKSQRLRAKINLEIMGYVREAQRLGHPFSLFRVVREDTKLRSGTGVKKGQMIHCNFGAAHKDPSAFDPDPDRKVPSIQGLGLHKCPGISFLDAVMPEIIRMVFRMDGLSPGEMAGRLVDERSPIPPYHRIFTNKEGVKKAYPENLVIVFANVGDKPFKRPQVAAVKFERTPKEMVMDFVAIPLIVLLSLFYIYTKLMTVAVEVIAATGLEIVGPTKLACNTPTTIFQKWDVHTIFPGPDGQPMPVEYTLDHRRPHRLSIVDIDSRDMQLAVYVDGVPHGKTTDFELDRSVNCGDHIATCLHFNYSGGVVVVPPGRHTVKIAWAGKEYIPGTWDMNWDGDYSRRFKWQMEHCA